MEDAELEELKSDDERMNSEPVPVDQEDQFEPVINEQQYQENQTVSVAIAPENVETSRAAEPNAAPTNNQSIQDMEPLTGVLPSTNDLNQMNEVVPRERNTTVFEEEKNGLEGNN